MSRPVLVGSERRVPDVGAGGEYHAQDVDDSRYLGTRFDNNKKAMRAYTIYSTTTSAWTSQTATGTRGEFVSI